MSAPSGSLLTGRRPRFGAASESDDSLGFCVTQTKGINTYRGLITFYVKSSFGNFCRYPLIIKVRFGRIAVLSRYTVLSENLGHDSFYVFCFHVEKEHTHILQQVERT